ncbi:Drebrin [Liparis tanakae]|uniref:Drebrin n=1 Tax=Liparis tanakae TaxID=230148 RepID=A0A4Z2EMB8_9TELE|nr:Drebrin [Liparis tanakae]
MSRDYCERHPALCGDVSGSNTPAGTKGPMRAERGENTDGGKDGRDLRVSLLIKVTVSSPSCPLPAPLPPSFPLCPAQVGEDVPDARKCACASHVASIADFLQGVEVTINASSLDDIDPLAIGQRLTNGTAALAASPVLSRLKTREEEHKDVREEEVRKEEEKKKMAEERQRFEEERMELERKEQESRELRYREREQQIEEHR